MMLLPIKRRLLILDNTELAFWIVNRTRRCHDAIGLLNAYLSVEKSNPYLN